MPFVALKTHGERIAVTRKGTSNTKVPSRLFDTKTSPRSLDELKRLTSRTVDPSIYTLASTISKNIPIYDLSRISITEPSQVSTFQDEIHHILLSGPGVVVLKHMYDDQSIIDATNAAFQSIIAREKANATGRKGDHFAASGKNDRIWNSFQKHALEDPVSFVRYYSNPWLAVVCDAWLGPGYRVTAQTNIVKPGGAAQVSHRDYHLGFQTEEACARFPRATQVASQLLTLQGAVAHSDMPLESGPTRFLPFSQLFEEGYVAYRRDEFVRHFEQAYVALPLEKGDAVFFSPALFHAAGANEMPEGGIERSANLLQVSSAFGKPMENIDPVKIVDACWEDMRRFADGAAERELQVLVQAVGEGYPFPTNLDMRPPAPGGMAPECDQDILNRGLLERWDKDRILSELRQIRQDSLA